MVEVTGNDKRISLLDLIINYGRKKFYNTGPWSNLVPFNLFRITSGASAIKPFTLVNYTVIS